MKNNTKIFLAIIFILIVIIILGIIIKDHKSEEQQFQKVDVKYNESQLSGFNLNIYKIDDKVTKKISNIDEILLKLKEYLYLKGIVNGDTLKFIQAKEDNNQINLKFEFNDDVRTKIIVDVNLNDNTYNFYDYK